MFWGWTQTAVTLINRKTTIVVKSYEGSPLTAFDVVNLGWGIARLDKGKHVSFGDLSMCLAWMLNHDIDDTWNSLYRMMNMILPYNCDVFVK